MKPKIPRELKTTTTVTAHSARPLTPHQRWIERFTEALGKPLAVYFALLAMGLWIALNLSVPFFGLTPVDPPPFHWLHVAVSLCALLMTLIILTTENRQGRVAEQRSQVDLEVNLISEHKIAKVIALLEELRLDLPSVRNRLDEEANAMGEPADPHAVAQIIENQLGVEFRSPKGGSS